MSPYGVDVVTTKYMQGGKQLWNSSNRLKPAIKEEVCIAVKSYLTENLIIS